MTAKISSTAAANSNSFCSLPGSPTIWRPTGSPSVVNATGNDKAGQPVIVIVDGRVLHECNEVACGRVDELGWGGEGLDGRVGHYSVTPKFSRTWTIARKPNRARQAPRCLEGASDSACVTNR